MAKSILQDRFLACAALFLILLFLVMGAIVVLQKPGNADASRGPGSGILISWFGTVVNSFGKPLEGVPVTLHMMGNDNGRVSELYNYTTNTRSGDPYPGSYAFEGVELATGADYGYVTADYDYGDGVVYKGMSNNYSLGQPGATNVSSGFVVLHIPEHGAVAPGQDNTTMISWFGSVVDSYGRPFGGVSVTLHMIGNDSGEIRELYNYTTTAYPDDPYPGSYVFDNVELAPEAAFGYVTAEADVGDGVVYRAASDNFSLNEGKPRISSGFVVLHVPMPDSIDLSISPETARIGGDNATATARLLLNGNPYKRGGLSVNISADNDYVVRLPGNLSALTDNDGKAVFTIGAGAALGEANLTVVYHVSLARNLTDTGTLKIVA